MRRSKSKYQFKSKPTERVRKLKHKELHGSYHRKSLHLVIRNLLRLKRRNELGSRVPKLRYKDLLGDCHLKSLHLVIRNLLRFKHKNELG